jgi:micrococcal nuclease
MAREERMALGKGLRRGWNTSGPRQPRARLRSAPWQPLAALAGVAGALWFAAEGYPAMVAGNGPLVTSGHGAFVLCAQVRAPNCVIDGDTIRYRGTKIRLEGIDAPEVFSPRCASEAARGERATRRLLELINAGPFEMVAGSRDEDRYGRKLRTIERGGRSLGDTLVAEGLARRWDGARRSWCG